MSSTDGVEKVGEGEFVVSGGTSMKIKAHLKTLTKDQLEEVVFDVLRACYYNDDEGWTMENEHGSDLSCDVLDAVGPLECEQFIPSSEEEG